jgi:hypothetical protein
LAALSPGPPLFLHTNRVHLIAVASHDLVESLHRKRARPWRVSSFRTAKGTRIRLPLSVRWPNWRSIVGRSRRRSRSIDWREGFRAQEPWGIPELLASELWHPISYSQCAATIPMPCLSSDSSPEPANFSVDSFPDRRMFFPARKNSSVAVVYPANPANCEQFRYACRATGVQSG